MKTDNSVDEIHIISHQGYHGDVSKAMAEDINKSLLAGWDAGAPLVVVPIGNSSVCMTQVMFRVVELPQR